MRTTAKRNTPKTNSLRKKAIEVDPEVRALLAFKSDVDFTQIAARMRRWLEQVEKLAGADTETVKATSRPLRIDPKIRRILAVLPPETHNAIAGLLESWASQIRTYKANGTIQTVAASIKTAKKGARSV